MNASPNRPPKGQAPPKQPAAPQRQAPSKQPAAPQRQAPSKQQAVPQRQAPSKQQAVPQRRTPPKQPAAKKRQAPPPRQAVPPLTPAQKRFLKEQQKRKREQAIANFRFYAVCTLVVYAVFVALFALVILAKLHSSPATEVELPSVFFANAEQDRFSSELKGERYSSEKLRQGNLLYVESDLLSRYATLSESGNHRLRTLHLNGQTAVFTVGTTSVCINGQYTSLSAPCILRNSRLCVPIDFFSECIQGLRLWEDGENQRYVIEKTEELGFVLQQDTVLDPIAYEAAYEQTPPPAPSETD